jgi:hypothetical protein
MVPGLAANVDKGKQGPYSNSSSASLPVVEYNKKTEKNLASPTRPVFEPLADSLVEEGLDSDPEKGAGTASARRLDPDGSPARVYGFSTPGGSTIHVDDGVLADESAKERTGGVIRIRSRTGAQIMINDEKGYIYANSKGGKSWLRISDEGGVEAFSDQQVSLRTSANYNLHSEGDLFIDCEKSLNIRAGADIVMGALGNIDIGCVGNLTMGGNGRASIQSAGNLGFKSGGDLNTQAGGDINQLAGGNAKRSASQIMDNSGGAASADAPTPKSPTRNSRRDVAKASEKGKSPSQTTRPTITSEMPTHEPYLNANAAPTVPTTSANAPTNVAPASTSKNMLARAASVNACVESALSQLKTRHPDGGFVTYEYMMTTAKQESGFKADANAKTSSAAGLYQFTKDTWAITSKQVYGNSQPDSLRNDACASANAAAELAYRNGKSLKANGIEPTPDNLYAAHFLGVGGATKFLRAAKNPANANVSARNFVSTKAANANESIFGTASNPKSVSEVQGFFNAKIGSQTVQWSDFRIQMASAPNTGQA